MNVSKNSSILKIKNMKNLFCSAALLALFAISSNAQAKGDDNLYQFGGTTGWVNYLEPGYISFYGLMYGVDGVIQLNYSTFDLRMEGSLLYGNVQYDGSVKDTRTGAIAPLKAGAYDYLLNFRIKPEFQFATVGIGEFYFNFGLGERYLNDRVNSDSGYQREINYIYIPIGLRLENKNIGNQSFSFDIEYDLFVVGKVKSHLSDTNAANPDVTNSQSTGWGARVEFEYRFLLGSISYGMQPYFQYWNVGTSDAQPYTQGLVLVEPQNSSSMVGLNFNVGFD